MIDATKHGFKVIGRIPKLEVESARMSDIEKVSKLFDKAGWSSKGINPFRSIRFSNGSSYYSRSSNQVDVSHTDPEYRISLRSEDDVITINDIKFIVSLAPKMNDLIKTLNRLTPSLTSSILRIKSRELQSLDLVFDDGSASFLTIDQRELKMYTGYNAAVSYKSAKLHANFEDTKKDLLAFLKTNAEIRKNVKFYG